MLDHTQIQLLELIKAKWTENSGVNLLDLLLTSVHEMGLDISDEELGRAIMHYPDDYTTKPDHPGRDELYPDKNDYPWVGGDEVSGDDLPPRI